MGIRSRLTIALLISLVTTSALAQSRVVFVNGQRMTDQQISQLEFFACTAIPDGNYWLNLNNGAWGYFGSWEVRGIFGDQCNGQAQRQRKSLSERGLLYSPGEILRGSP
jgi:hypothetical protein